MTRRRRQGRTVIGKHVLCYVETNVCGSKKLTYFGSDQQKKVKKMGYVLKCVRFLHNKAAARFIKLCYCKWLNI
jgi:hypothetical protein